MVAVASGSPSGRQALPRGEPRRKARPFPRSATTRSCVARAGDDALLNTDSRLSDRREVEAHKAPYATAEAAHGTAEKRSPHGFERNVVGFRNRRLMEGSAGRKVRTVADGVWALSPMARAGTLAANSADAPTLTMKSSPTHKPRSKWHCRIRACLTIHEGSHSISEAMTTIAR